MKNRPRNKRRPRNGENWQICQILGPFESEGILVQYLEEIVGNGDGETFSFGDGGASDTVIDGPFDAASLREFRGDVDYNKIGVGLNRSEKRFAQQSCGAILHCRSDGFFSARWYPNTPKGQERFAKAQDDLVEEYSSDDDEEEEWEDEEEMVEE
jgi:hypothetical protein